MPFASCPFTGCHWEDFGSIFFTASHQGRPWLDPREPSRGWAFLAPPCMSLALVPPPFLWSSAGFAPVHPCLSRNTHVWASACTRFNSLCADQGNPNAVPVWTYTFCLSVYFYTYIYFRVLFGASGYIEQDFPGDSRLIKFQFVLHQIFGFAE